MPFQIVRNNIVNMPVDAIVNAANSRLQMGGGVCGAIFSAAGPDALQKACDKIGSCPTGSAVITPGFSLKARWIIHAVGPVWEGGSHNEESLLRSAYLTSLRLAAAKGIRSIAFPLISSGIYGYPKDQALQVALRAIQNFLLVEGDLDVFLVVFDKTAFSLSSKLIQGVQSYIDEHFVEQAEASDRRRSLCENLPEQRSFAAPMPIKTDSFPDRLDSVIAGIRAETFSDMVLRLIDERGFAKDSIVYKRANLERSVFSKMRSNRHYAPSKSTALALAVALELNIDLTLDLLRCAGYSLSPSSLSDVIVSYFIEHNQFDIFEINAALFEYGLPCLGSKG